MAAVLRKLEHEKEHDYVPLNQKTILDERLGVLEVL
jgi:hypothetical protein